MKQSIVEEERKDGWLWLWVDMWKWLNFEVVILDEVGGGTGVEFKSSECDLL